MNKKQTPLDEIPGFAAWLSVARACQMCQRQLTIVLEPLGLECPHYDVLVNVFREEGLSQQVLARRLLIAKSNVSALLTALERKALIERAKDPADARVRRINLTELGRRITIRGMGDHAKLVAQMMGALTPTEAEIVRVAMGKIAIELEPDGAGTNHSKVTDHV
jgi:DNA-binding MarR family transcriptional regulator